MSAKDDSDRTPHDEAVDLDRDEAVADPVFLKALLPWMERYASYFDAEVRGWENIPHEGGVLLVGNHSGATVVPDTAAFIAAWYREMGLDRRLTGLAHDTMFKFPPLANFMRKIGETPANHENAGEALDAGAAVLVYPGGAYDAFRPWTHRNKIEFAGHRGFVRLALRMGVPVVPVVGHGGHDTTIVLARGDAIAEKTGLKDIGIPVSPILWQIPWGFSLPPLQGIPLPAKITMQILPPMNWSSLPPDAAEDPEIVDRCYDEIVSAMQASLDALVKETPNPVVSRIRRWLGGWIRS